MFNYVDLHKTPFITMIIWIFYSILTGQGWLLVVAIPSVLSIIMLNVIDIEIHNRLEDMKEVTKLFWVEDKAIEVVEEFENKAWYKLLTNVTPVSVIGMMCYLLYALGLSMYGIM